MLSQLALPSPADENKLFISTWTVGPWGTPTENRIEHQKITSSQD